MNGQIKELPVFYLKGSDLFVSKKPAKVVTVLGSCVCVTMFDSHLGIAAICHALLPVCAKKETCIVSCAEPFKYVNCVVPDMVRRMRRYGIRPRKIEVKLFGGSDMFGPRTKYEKTASVGRQNIEAAVRAISGENLLLKVTDVGGLLGRKIFFYTHTGEVWLKRLK